MQSARTFVRRFLTIASITWGFFALLMYRDFGRVILSPVVNGSTAHADAPTGPGPGYEPNGCTGGPGGDGGNGCGACGCAGTSDTGCMGSDCGAASDGDSGCDGCGCDGSEGSDGTK